MKFTIAGKTVEVNDTVLSKALEEKTETLDVTTDLIVRTPDEEATFVRNKKTEHMAEGVEVAVKAVKNELKLEFTGKTINALVEAAKTKGAEEAGVTPDARVTKLEADNKLLKESNLTLAQEKETAISDKQKAINQIKIDATIEKLLPEKLVLPKEDMITLLKGKLTFDMDDKGKVVVKDGDGNVMKNATTADPLDPKSVMEDYFKTNQQYVTAQSGGAGGGDSKAGAGGDKIPLSEFIKTQQEAGVAPNSEQFETAFEAAKDTIDTDK